MTLKTRAELKAENSSDFPDNTTRAISPADLRGQMDDTADSALLREDIPGLDVSAAVVTASGIGSQTLAEWMEGGITGPPGPPGAADDEPYDAATWDDVTDIAPSKNAVRDKFVAMDAEIDAIVVGGSFSTQIILADRMTLEQRAGMASANSADWPYIDALLNAAIAEGAGTIILPRGRMRMASTGNVHERVKIIGENNGGSGQIATQLIWDADLDGFIVHAADTGGSLGNASGTHFQGIAFLGQRNVGATVGSGIWMRAKATIKDCMFEQWPEHGVKIVASVAGGVDVLGNANCWYMENVRIYQSGSHGLYVFGTDANAGTAILLDLTDNFGSGIYDWSFLGNTYVACHAAANSGTPYTTVNVNSCSVFVGCYQESGQPASDFSVRTLVLGGLWGVRPVGGQRVGFVGLANNNITPFVSRNLDNVSGGYPDKTLRCNIHVSSWLDCIIQGEDSNGMSLAYYDQVKKEIQWRYEAASTSIPMRLTTHASPPHVDEATGTASIGPAALIMDRIWVPNNAGSQYRRMNLLPVARQFQQQTIATDAAFSLFPGLSPYHTLHTGTLTLPRTITLSTTSAANGMAFKVSRTGTGSGLSVGGLVTLATGDWAEVVYDGTAWYVAARNAAASTAVPIVAYAGTARAIATADHNTTINCTSASAVTLTVPSGLTSGVADAFACGIRQGGAGKVTIAAGGGVTIRNIDGLLGTEAIYARLILENIATDEYDLIGRTG